MSNRTSKSKKVIHIEYTRAFNEVLKYEEVLDIKLDKIYQTYLRVIAKLREVKDLRKPPKERDIQFVIDKILNHLKVK